MRLETTPCTISFPRPGAAGHRYAVRGRGGRHDGLCAAEKSEATRKAYAADWRDFSRWCGARLAATLPAHPGIVASYLSDLAQQGCKASTIGRRAAAIGYHHKMAGHESPTSQEGVRAVMKGIRRTIGIAPVKKHAATADIVMRMLAQCGDKMIGRRDRALIAVGMAGAFRRSELIALTINDIEETKEGLLITIRRSKGDQEGQGRWSRSRTVITSARSRRCPYGWTSAGITDGLLFRSVALGGRLGDSLSAEATARIVKKLANALGSRARTLPRTA